MRTLPLNLTLEQEFNLVEIDRQIETLSSKDAKSMIHSLIRQIMIKDNLVKHFIMSEIEHM